MKNNDKLRRLKTEYIGKSFSYICGIFIVVVTLAITFFIANKGIKLFVQNKYPITDFLFSTDWNPDAEVPKYGALIFIIGSTLVSFGAIIISSPIAIALAIFINMISPKVGKKIIQPSLELFVGIPSVVYGWIGVSTIVPFIRRYFDGVGFSLLAAIAVLSIMILPTIASLANDAIKTVPKDYIEASYGLGATRWQTIYKVVVPSSKSGILTGIIFGISRAFGEALAVQMVIGNAVNIPKVITSPTSTLTSILTMDMANTAFGSSWNNSLWSLAFVLLVISFIFIIITRKIGARGEYNEG